MPSRPSTLSQSTKFSDWDNQIFTAADALSPHPPKQYLVEPIFVLPSLNIVFGKPKSLKTMLMVDMACSVALGSPWLLAKPSEKTNPFQTIPSGVLWIDVDSGKNALHERFGATLRTYKLKPHQTIPLWYISFPDPPFNALSKDARFEVIRRALDHKVHLIVFDNLAMVSGGAEENTSEMATVMLGLRTISESTGAVVIAIHHDTKSEKGKRSSRGHSSIRGAVSLELNIEREGDVITAIPTATRDAQFDPFSALWTFDWKKGSARELETSRFLGVEAPIDENEQKAIDAIVDLIKKNRTATQTELIAVCRTCHIGRNGARTVIASLVRNKILREQTGLAHNASVYSKY